MNNNRQILDGYFYQLLNEYKRNLFNNCVTGFQWSAQITDSAINEAAWEDHENDLEYIKEIIAKKVKKAMIKNYKEHIYEEGKLNKEYYKQLTKESKNG